MNMVSVFKRKLFDSGILSATFSKAYFFYADCYIEDVVADGGTGNTEGNASAPSCEAPTLEPVSSPQGEHMKSSVLQNDFSPSDAPSVFVSYLEQTHPEVDATSTEVRKPPSRYVAFFDRHKHEKKIENALSSELQTEEALAKEQIDVSVGMSRF